MAFWGRLNLLNAGNVIIERIIYFHDFMIILLRIIIIFIIYVLIYNIYNTKLNIKFLESHSLEFIWTVFPIIILIFMAYPSLIILYFIENSELNLTSRINKVIAHQWYWEYENNENSSDRYILSNPQNFYTLERTDRIILPLNSIIQLYITSRDVLHSFTIPRLGVKVDAIPGRLNTLNFNINFPGIYFGQCSEICGTNHRFIPIQILAI